MASERTDAPTLDLPNTASIDPDDVLQVDEADAATDVGASVALPVDASTPAYVGDPVMAILLGRQIGTPTTASQAINDVERVKPEPFTEDDELSSVARASRPWSSEKTTGETLVPHQNKPLPAPTPSAISDVTERVVASSGAWWTLPTMCVGLCLIAASILVPAADENRRAAHELAKIDNDVAHFQKQSEVNKAFLDLVSSDPTLAERLAIRQLRLTRADARIAPLQASHPSDAWDRSPGALVHVPRPAPLADYVPMGGFLARWFLDAQRQFYLTGLGILLTAAGVIFGGGVRERAIADNDDDADNADNADDADDADDASTDASAAVRR